MSNEKRIRTKDEILVDYIETHFKTKDFLKESKFNDYSKLAELEYDKSKYVGA